jgi:disulfide bond formation protein DsbB
MSKREAPISPNHEEPLITRSGAYEPEPPERLSPVDRWVLRVEVAVVVALCAAVGFRYVRAHRPDTTPVKISSLAMPRASIPPGALSAAEGALASAADAGNAEKGQVLYMQTCTSCHGQKAQGLPHMGLNLRDSKFVAQQNDTKLVAFLKQGRKPTDPKNSTGLLMPPRGGNPQLDDDALGDIVAFLRAVQREEQAQQGAPTERQASDDKGSPTASATPQPATRPVASLDVGTATHE